MDLPEEATCHFCHKVLYGGRSDRKFCNDTCRNAYNRNRRKAEAAYVSESQQELIIRVLKRNYRILEKFNPLHQYSVIADRTEMHGLGFFFNYFTGCEQLADGTLRYFCFEHYWEEREYGLVELGVDESKLEVVYDL